MVAVVAPHPQPHRHPAPSRPRLRLVEPVVPPPGTRRSVTPPPRAVPTPATFWRRRALALLVLTTLAVASHLLASSVLGRGDPTVVTGSASASVVGPGVPALAAAAPTAAEPAVYVVRPGDTVWSIASALEPDGDVRALVDQLTERAGGATLQAGQRISLDGLGV